MFHPESGLRYRGKNPKIKAKFERRRTQKTETETQTQTQTISSQELEKQSQEKLSGIQKFYQSIQERPEYQAPPKGTRVSYAYGAAPSILDTIWAEGQVLYQNFAAQFGLSGKLEDSKPSLKESQTIFQNLIRLLKATPNLMKQINDALAPEDKALVGNISNEVSKNYLARMVMSLFHIEPATFTILSLLANVGVASAESNPIIKRIVKIPALQNLKNILSNGTYSFVDGIPPNGTDMCSNERDFWNFCEQFYVEQDNTTLLTSMSASASQGPPPADFYNWPCLGTDGMKQHIKDILDDPNLISRIDSNAPECLGNGPDYSAFARVDGLSRPGCLRLNEITSKCIVKQSSETNLVQEVMIFLDSAVGLTIIVAGACYWYRRRMLANDPSELQAISKKNNKKANSNVNSKLSSEVSDVVITSQSNESKANAPTIAVVTQGMNV
jgi:hypothetical protein